MDVAFFAQGHITAVIYSPVCEAHTMHHAAINSMSVYLQFQEGPLLLDSLLMTLLLTSFLSLSSSGYIGVQKEATIMLNHLSPRSICLVYNFVIAVSFVLSPRTNLWSSSAAVSSIKDSIIEPEDHKTRFTRKQTKETSCQIIITDHTFTCFMCFIY